jgi:hypothetical protein
MTYPVRDWAYLESLPESHDFTGLQRLCNTGKKTYKTNCPALHNIGELADRVSRRPLMLCEYGFGDTTYRLLEYCVQNNGYLVTVDMPVCAEKYKETDKYEEMYYWGTDRYAKKHPHATALLDHPIAKKRWVWINDDIFTFNEALLTDPAVRKGLFKGGKIDYFYEDAIHDDKFLGDLSKRIRPFLSPGGIFTGDDNARNFAIL